MNFRNILRAIILFCAFAADVTAQTSQGTNQGTVFTRVFNQVSTAQASANVPQQGQSLHNVTVLFPTATGDVSGFAVRTEASYDGAVYFPISNDITTAQFSGQLASVTARSNGTYPYVRLRIVTPASIPMSVYYTGGPMPIPVIPATATAAAFTTPPAICPPGKAPQGIDASGNAIACGTPKEYISVLDFGAIGDGVHNDTAAVNAAKAAAAAQGKTRIHFPATIGGYLLDPISIDGFRLTGEYTRTNFSDGVGSRLIMNPLATAGNFITMEPASGDNLHQNSVSGLWIDCNHIGINGLLFSAVNGRVEDVTVSNCTNTGLVNDGSQNSVFQNIDLQHNNIADRLVNGASSNTYDRIEHADSATVHERIGLDASLPGAARQAALQVPTNNRNTFANSIYSDGGSYTYALDLDASIENTWKTSIFTPGTNSAPLTALIHTGTTGYANRFENNSYYMGAVDVPVFRNQMPTTYVDAGSFQLKANCTGHPITIDAGSMNFSGTIHWNDGCYTNVGNNTQYPTAWLLTMDDSYRGGQTWQRAARPAGTTGQTYYDYDLGKLLVWDRTHYVGPYGEDPASAAPSSGGGSTPDTRPLQVTHIKPNPTSTSINLFHGTTQTIFSDTGEGNVSMIQLALIVPNQINQDSANAATIDSLISICTDGQPDPCEQSDNGSFFLWHGEPKVSAPNDSFMVTQFSNTNGGTQTPGACPSNYTCMGGFRRIFIPYHNGISIKLTNRSSDGDVLIFSQVYYRHGTIPAALTGNGRKMKFHIAKQTGATATAAFSNLAPYQRVDVQSVQNVAGQLEGITMVTVALQPGRPYWLEGNPWWGTDGNPTQSVGGTEDFFGGQFYWDMSQHSTDSWGLAARGPYGNGSYVCFSFYRLYNNKEENYLTWNSAYAFSWENGEPGQSPTPPNVLVSITVTYYTAT